MYQFKIKVRITFGQNIMDCVVRPRAVNEFQARRKVLEGVWEGGNRVIAFLKIEKRKVPK